MARRYLSCPVSWSYPTTMCCPIAMLFPAPRWCRVSPRLVSPSLTLVCITTGSSLAITLGAQLELNCYLHIPKGDLNATTNLELWKRVCLNSIVHIPDLLLENYDTIILDEAGALWRHFCTEFMNQIHMKVLEQLRAMLTSAKTFLLQIVQKNGHQSNSSSSSQLVFLLWCITLADSTKSLSNSLWVHHHHGYSSSWFTSSSSSLNDRWREVLFSSGTHGRFKRRFWYFKLVCYDSENFQTACACKPIKAGELCDFK